MFPLCKIPMDSEVSDLELARESRLALFEFFCAGEREICVAKEILARFCL